MKTGIVSFVQWNAPDDPLSPGESEGGQIRCDCCGGGFTFVAADLRGGLEIGAGLLDQRVTFERDCTTRDAEGFPYARNVRPE